MATRALTYMAPGVDRDTSPTWSHDGNRLAFIRRPGLPFGQQAQRGGGGVGLPDGPAFNPNAQGGVGRGGGRAAGGRGGGRAGNENPADRVPGLTRAAFTGGYTMSIWVGDPATGEAREAWHTTPDEQVFTGINNIQWADGHAVFSVSVPNDEWDRYFSVALGSSSVHGPVTVEPVLLTSTDGIIEGATSVTLSRDGRTLFYSTNHADMDRCHVWAVPTAGGARRQVSLGAGIETSPMALASGRWFAALSATARRPQSVGIFSMDDAEPRVIFPELPADFPLAAHVDPTAVTLRVADDVEFYNQLFLPSEDVRPGERRPAVIFIFKAGVDLAGVHLWGSSLDPDAVSYQSSAIAAIGTWTSPVLVFHGDDDRNVAFQQTTGLVQLLRAHDVPFELVVFPDDVHDSLVHRRWIDTFERTRAFLDKYLKR